MQVKLIVRPPRRVGLAAAALAGVGAMIVAPSPGVADATGRPELIEPIPEVPGEMTVGSALTGTNGKWRNATDYDYYWARCPHGSCSILADWEGRSYVLREADVGSRMQFVVVAFNDAGDWAEARSPMTATVTAAPPPGPGGGNGAGPPPQPEPGPTPPGPGASGAPAAAAADGDGAPTSGDARLVASASGRDALHTRITARVPVTGRLLTRDGHPIPGAMLQVSARERAAGAATTLIGTAMTRADGTFSYTVPPGPSRRIIVTYRAAPADARPVAAAAVRLRVPARVAFSVRPARAGRVTWMRGRLRDRGRQGVQIQMQALDGRVWRTFDTTTTRRAGVFRFGYRFKPTAAGRTFHLRVLVDSPIYPFDRGASRSVRVRVPR